MSYHQRYLDFRQELWNQFVEIVRVGATLPELIDVTYPRGVNPSGLPLDIEGRSWAQARSIEANPDYELHRGVDIVLGTNAVVFTDLEGNQHRIEPDDLDIYWLSILIDSAVVGHRAV